jgi:hypothetical protein
MTNSKFIKKKIMNQEFYIQENYTSKIKEVVVHAVIPALGKQRQKGYKFEGSLEYIVKLCLKKLNLNQIKIIKALC